MTRADLLRALAEAESHLRAEADFNRSWTDGAGHGAEYRAQHRAYAEQRERWAAAIAEAAVMIETEPTMEPKK